MKEFIFGLAGGTALLMYGVDKMGEGLEKASGEMMKKILYVLTGNVFSAVLIGTFLTALVQSSTAITVLTVGFVNAGLMKLPQAVGIIYGANIGTTITAQLMAFSFKFKLTDIALPVIGIGFLISYMAKKKTLKSIGDAVMGFGLMFLGLKILNGGVPFIQNNEQLKVFFENYASIPLVGVFLGGMATALVHSSAATVGLVIVLGNAGLIDLSTAIYIMLGDNIGTCITAQLASLTGNINARRTAWAHTLYNIIGVSIVAILFPVFLTIIKGLTSYFQPNSDLGVYIANSHTLFNVLSAVIFLPITKYYVKFLELVIKPKDKAEETNQYLDKLLLDTPVAAIKATVSEIIRSAEVSKKMFLNVIDAYINNKEEILSEVEEKEELLNNLQKNITSYIVELSKRSLSDFQSSMIPAMISGINNIERIGDHTMDLANLVRSKIDKKLNLSDEAKTEIIDLEDIVIQMFDGIVESMKNSDETYVDVAAKLENDVDLKSQDMISQHIKRLENGKCTVESGVIYMDVISHIERISDHIYKVAKSISKGKNTIAATETSEN